MKANLYEDFETLIRLAPERGPIARNRRLKILVRIVGGIVFLPWVSGVFAGTNTLSQTTSDSAPTNMGPSPTADQSAGTSSSPALSAAGESQRTYYHLPDATKAELLRDNEAIEVQKSLVLQLENQLNVAKSALAEQKVRADALGRQLEVLKAGIDKAKGFVDQSDPLSIASFNSRVAKYDDLLSQVREQWKRTNALDEPFNDLVNKLNAQNLLVNQMVNAYNAKLKRVGYEAESKCGPAIEASGCLSPPASSAGAQVPVP